jgi:predicted enzyme related to lactoylglutathione lyase
MNQQNHEPTAHSTAAPAPAIGLVLDCVDPDRLAQFWAPALGYVHLGTFGSYAALFPDGRPGPKLLLQKVEEAKVAKNRMHFDIETPDIETEVERLVALGGSRVDVNPISEHGTTWIRMSDPEGNEFCVCDAGQGASS